MVVQFRIPVLALLCEKCEQRAAVPTRVYGDKAEVEIACRCPVPELVLAFFYPENHRVAVNTMRLEQSPDRRIREGNDAMASRP